MNNMKINRLKIVNYKLFQNVTIEMNENINIFVGENDSGKSTILEALSMVLTGKINGSSVANRLNLDWFNAQVRQKFKESIEAGNTSDLPTIEIEVYFASPDEDEIAIKKYRGTNNSLHEDAEGVKLEIIFDTQYAPAYKQLLVEGKVRDIPVEYYRVNFRSFANPEYYVQTTARKVACIDTTKKDYGPVLSRFVSTSINEYLSEEDMTELRHAYRANRHEFTENQAVIRLNQKLQEGHSFDGKTIGLNLRESGIDEWKGDMSISLDGIPLENSGFCTQNMFKSEIFLLQNTDVDILIIEEPENNLSYSNMSILISKLSDSNGKQLFISTHSSFVANKLGLQCLHLVANARTTPFKSLSSDTYIARQGHTALCRVRWISYRGSKKPLVMVARGRYFSISIFLSGLASSGGCRSFQSSSSVMIWSFICRGVASLPKNFSSSAPVMITSRSSFFFSSHKIPSITSGESLFSLSSSRSRFA